MHPTYYENVARGPRRYYVTQKLKCGAIAQQKSTCGQGVVQGRPSAGQSAAKAPLHPLRAGIRPSLASESRRRRRALQLRARRPTAIIFWCFRRRRRRVQSRWQRGVIARTNEREATLWHAEKNDEQV